MAQLDQILSDDTKFDKAAKAVFEGVDSDKSGSISKAELGNAMVSFTRETGLNPPTDADVEKAFTQLDLDRSGSIDFNEFKVYMRRLLEKIR